jgi:very-short-patch-repair endonuclease
MSKEPRTAASSPLPGRGERIQVRGFGNSSRKKSRPPKSATTARARNLRKNAPDCERFLWRELRNRKFANYKFWRQHPVDAYTLDFYCPALKLAIELDGSGHSYRIREQRDRVREKFQIKRGITVLRFWNHQVREELESVVEAIWLTLEERNAANPSPSSSPFAKGRGETRPSTSKG